MPTLTVDTARSVTTSGDFTQPLPGADQNCTVDGECADTAWCDQSGQVSPFIPMQSAEAVHMGLVWKKNSDQPKLLYHARFPEYTPNDVADPALTDLAISRGALTTAGVVPGAVAAEEPAELADPPDVAVAAGDVEVDLGRREVEPATGFEHRQHHRVVRAE